MNDKITKHEQEVTAMEKTAWVVQFENGDEMEVTADSEESAVETAYTDGSHDGVGHWGAYRVIDRA